MRLKTSKSIMGFAGISFACAILGGIVQVNQNLNSSRLESSRSKAMTTIAQHVLSDTCRRSEGGKFQKGQEIQEQGGLTPTSCYENELGDRAYAAYAGQKLIVVEVFSRREIDARISQLKGEKK